MILEAICNSTLLQSKKEGAQGARVPHAVYSSLEKSVHVPAHAVYSSLQAQRATHSQVSRATQPQAQRATRPTSAYAATFKRIEKKYCLTAEQYEKLLPCIQGNMQPDEYPQTVVSSLL